MTTDEQKKAQEVGARIRQLREHLNKSQGAFAKLLGITQGRLSQIESGESMPTSEQVEFITQNFSTTYEWLIKGVGNLLAESNSNYLPNRNDCDALRVRCELQEKLIEKQDKEIEYLRKQAEFLLNQQASLIAKIPDNK